MSELLSKFEQKLLCRFIKSNQRQQKIIRSSYCEIFSQYERKIDLQKI